MPLQNMGNSVEHVGHMICKLDQNGSVCSSAHMLGMRKPWKITNGHIYDLSCISTGQQIYQLGYNMM